MSIQVQVFEKDGAGLHSRIVEVGENGSTRISEAPVSEEMAYHQISALMQRRAQKVEARDSLNVQIAADDTAIETWKVVLAGIAERQAAQAPA